MSDNDSGIILHSGSDSPTSHSKDVTTHTRAMKLKHQALQERLELCLQELRQLCIREAELTGKLSEDFPLKPGEKPPQIRRRVGAAFKLDELSLPHTNGDSDLSSVEAALSLQMKIYEAARRLCGEQRMSKGVRKSRLQQCKREQLKLKQLQDTAFKLRLEHGRTSPLPAFNLSPPDPGTSDDSSLSDSVVQDEEVCSSSQLLISEPDAPPPLSAPSTPCSLNSAPYGLSGSLQGTPCPSPRLDSSLSLNSSLALDDPPPIEHSPWSESNLDQPLDPKKKSRSSSKKSCTPVKTELLPPLEECLAQSALNSHLSHLKLTRSQSNSTPSTPEMRVHRQLSLRLSGPEASYNHEKERGRTRSARRRLTDFAITYNNPTSTTALKPSLNYNNHAGSEDSNSEHSYSSYNSSPCHETPTDLPKQYHAVFSNGSYQAQLFPQASFYHHTKTQSSPKAYYEDMVYPADMDMGRSYYGQSPAHSNRYEYWYKEAPVQQYQRVHRTPDVRLTPPPPQPHWDQRNGHGPSFRAGFSPQQVVNEQLKSWHRRSSQLKAPRSRSLDRQGAVRFKSAPAMREVYQTPTYQDQATPRRAQRPLDDSPGHWTVDDGTHYMSQV
uniref:Cytohesin Ubiquitin Protein Inducing domain-containing protein n=1 Tax=Knipowitschia caucasica TaxID=637954 RepID=A0AAV2M501_KNICA